jgi:hypothetical protein
MNWARTRAAAMGSRLLTAWSIARPLSISLILILNESKWLASRQLHQKWKKPFTLIPEVNFLGRPVSSLVTDVTKLHVVVWKPLEKQPLAKSKRIG